MSEVLLPLFPLQVVLFPNAVLPLHIFEERYRQLVNECLDEERKEFGINLAQENEVARIGCTATVSKLLKRHDDGRMDILVQGQRRYALRELVESSSLYSVGKVEFLDSHEEFVDAALASETVRLHNQLIVLVYRDNEFELVLDAVNPLLSFTIAQKAGMELAQRQRLLELNSENERLKLLHQYFVEIIPKLETGRRSGTGYQERWIYRKLNWRKVMNKKKRVVNKKHKKAQERVKAKRRAEVTKKKS